MNPEAYLTQIKTQLNTSIMVSSFQIVEEWDQPDRGYIRVRIQLVNSDFLEVAEYFVVSGEKCVTERYRYQWMDGERQHLRRRWDNVEHYPNLPGFPDHVHLADGQVLPGPRLNIPDLLLLLATELSPQDD